MSSTQEDAAPGPADVPAVRRPLARKLQLVLGALAVSLLTAGVGLAEFLAIDAVDYRYWPADADFTSGGPAHEVALESGETFLLWKWAPFDTPECSVRTLPSATR